MKDEFKKKVIISVSIIVSTIIIATIGVYFLTGSLADQATAMANDRMLIAQQSAEVASLARLKADAPKAAQYEAAIDSLLPDQYQLVGFDKWVTYLATKYGVVTRTSFQGETAAAGPGAFGRESFFLDIRGSLASSTALLKNLESDSQKFLLSVDSFNITNGTTPTGVEVVARGNLFFR